MFSKQTICSVILVLCLLWAMILTPFSSYASGQITWTLETLEGDTITESTFADDVQLLVFYNATQGMCSNSLRLIKELGYADWVDQDGLRVIAIDGHDNEAEAVEAFREEFAPDSSMIFALKGSSVLWEYIGSTDFVQMYCFCVILQDGEPQEIWSSCYSAEDCKDCLAKYVDFDEPENTYSEDMLEVEVPGRFRQSEMRKELELINEFRTGEDAWYWNSDNSSKTWFNGEGQTKLQPLVYDYDLEKIAMQRAVELAVNFDHIRPDGTWYYESINKYNPSGENIAAGYRTAESVFYGWCEEDEPYEWQGHRRSMLAPFFTAVGLGAFEHNGRTYWVQEFGGKSSNAAETTANDEMVTGLVESLPVYAESLLYSYDDTIKVFRQYALPYSDGTESLKFKYELKNDQFISVDEIPEPVTVLVPSYDESGRFLGLSEMTVTDFADAQQGASDVKILCVDDAFVPLSEGMVIALE